MDIRIEEKLQEAIEFIDILYCQLRKMGLKEERLKKIVRLGESIEDMIYDMKDEETR